MIAAIAAALLLAGAGLSLVAGRAASRRRG
jgi:hypothetical protein